LKLSLHIARRYLFSKKSVNIINIISLIAALGVAVGTMALIIVLSAFNGIDFFIRDMLSNFDPDLKISVIKGKSFSPEEIPLDKIYHMKGVISHSEVIEENALLSYKGSQKYVSVKGVDNNYASFSGIIPLIVRGNFVMRKDSVNYMAMGIGVAYNLSLRYDTKDPVQIYFPSKKTSNILSLSNSLNHNQLFLSGIFSVQQDIDTKYVIVPFSFANSFFEMNGKISSVEIKLNPEYSSDKIKKKIQKLTGTNFKVQNRFEQHALFYKVMRSEKWSSFLILSFILTIASFSLLGSITMIIIDKRKDTFILKSMGAEHKLIRNIFLFEGWLISGICTVSGIILGITLVWAQKTYELLKLPSNGGFALSSYPVKLEFNDVLITFIIVLAIGGIASWLAVGAVKQNKD